MLVRAAALRSGLCASALVLAAGACGARTTLGYGPPKPPEPECAVDADCLIDGDLCKPRACEKLPYVLDDGAGGAAPRTVKVETCVDLAPVDCDDGDPCTADVCEPETGICSYSPATFDLDDDGHRAPRPGFKAGAIDACGDDCDDSNPAAFPGNGEVCDGADNDCNGIVDDNASFIPLGNGDIQISNSAQQPSGSGGLAFNGSSFAGVYTSKTSSGNQVLVTNISADGEILHPPGEQAIPVVNGDGSSGPIVWVGDRYGVAWSDRRTGDYEVYFSILDELGVKKHADTQVTNAPDFSINVSLAWNQTEFILVWVDDREGPHTLYGQRMSVDAEPIGENIKLTSESGEFGHEAPSTAAGQTTLGVASGFNNPVDKISMVDFQTFAVDLSAPVSPRVTLSDGVTKARYPSAVWNSDRYVVAWQQDGGPQANGIWAATMAEDGTILTPAKQVTHPGTNLSVDAALRPLGDRVLLVFADNRDGPRHEIYSVMLSNSLDPLSPETRITNAIEDSTNPIPAFGAAGDVGILFTDHRTFQDEVYFTRLGCVAGP